MKLLAVLTLGLLPFSALAAKKGSASVDRFDKYHGLQRASAALKLDDDSYNDLISVPRNYSAAILLTAREARFGCALCKEFQPEWDLLAKSWVQGDKAGESKVVFGTLDFSDGKSAFQQLQLQTVPVLILYGPTVGEHAKSATDPERYAFSDGSGEGEKIHGWISRHLPPGGPRPAIVRPVNWIKIVSITSLLLTLISVLSVAGPYIIPIVQNRRLWAGITLISILLFTSGHMFNHIRKVQYVAGDGQGGISYFAGGFQSQYGLETQIVAAMYGVLAFATIALAMKVPKIADPKTQQVAVFAWGFILLGMYSFLLSVFRTKNGGYPFWLPPF